MNILKKILLLSFIILFAKCASSVYTIQNRGDIAEIQLITYKSSAVNEFSIELELVVITDTSIVALQFVHNISHDNQLGKVIEIPFSSIKKIEIMGYSNNDWILPVIFLQVIPAIILTITAITVDEENAAIIVPLLIPAALTAGLFAISDEETPSFIGRDLFEENDQLKQFARYPNGLSTENFVHFLSLYGQTKTEFLFK